MSRPTAVVPAHLQAGGEPELVTLTIDGEQVSVPTGTLLIRAAEALDTEIPRFCDHPLLDPVGACRQCLVEVDGQRKPVTACTTVVAAGMVVRTQRSSPMADTAQRGVMELLLINHPLDCPVCDKGGECPLQNQAMTRGSSESRFTGPKRTFPKPIAISDRILLDRERCVQCARCTRFADQIAGDGSLELLERGSIQQVGVAQGRPFRSYFSGNTIQICPVGALTSVDYRFRARPFDLTSTPGVCEHCASGCALRTDVRRGRVLRRLAAEDRDVNEEWNCDKGRWGFRYTEDVHRLNHPRVRTVRYGPWDSVAWSVAFEHTAEGLARAAGRTAMLTGGRLTLEDAYVAVKFARVVLGTNDVDFRARPVSSEETQFLAACVAGTRGPHYADLERAPVVLMVGFEPEEESPIVFLRLRKAVRSAGLRVFSVAALTTRGLAKLGGALVRCVPGAEAHVLDGLAPDATPERLSTDLADLARLLAEPGAVILVGERLAEVPGGLSAAIRLAVANGASLGWIPRRAGDRGAVEAGALPNLLPGGRPVTDPLARARVAAVWSVTELPRTPGRDTEQILAAAAGGGIEALVVAGVDLADLRYPRAALRALERVPFLVSLELRDTAVTRSAHVSFPVAPVPEKAGSYVNWEGRRRRFGAAVRAQETFSDAAVLTGIARSMGHDLGSSDVDCVGDELDRLSGWTGRRPDAPNLARADRLPAPGPGEAVLATWRSLLDNGSLQEKAGATSAVACVAAATAAEVGLDDGDLVRVSAAGGSLTLPVTLTDLPERVVWVPTNSTVPGLRAALAVTSGEIVRLTRVGGRAGDRRLP